MKEILFVGDMRSPFIQGDREQVGKYLTVRTFDMGDHNTENKRPVLFGWKVVLKLLAARPPAGVWIWFADYHAVPFMLLAKFYGIPVVVMIGGYEVSKKPEIGYGTQLSRWRGLISRWVIRNANVAVTTSEAYRPIAKEVEPQGVYVSIPPVALSADQLSRPIPKKDELVVTAMFSNNRVLKGVDVFEKAVSVLACDSAVLVGADREVYEDTLNRAKVYCQLSYCESFGVSVVEAMAKGCIPVVSDREGLPEVVGDVGIIVPYGNVPATSEAIRRAMLMDSQIARDRAQRFDRKNREGRVRNVLKMIELA